MRSKQIYLASTPDIRGLHEKALLESAIFGLPMLKVNMPGTRDTTSGPGSIIGGTNGFEGTPVRSSASSGRTCRHHVAPDVHSVAMKDLAGGTATATYYSGTNGVVTNPGEPAIPLEARNVTVPGRVLRGVGFRGGSYIDKTRHPAYRGAG